MRAAFSKMMGGAGVSAIAWLATAWVVCVGAVGSARGQASLPYTQNFEGAIGSEWSDATVSSHATFTRVLGRFGNTGTTLTVATTPGMAYEIVFDLWAFDSWDGPSSTDTFRILVNGSAVLSLQCPGSFQGEIAYHGNSWFSGWNDGVYRNLRVRFVATSTSTAINFDGEGLQDISDESWGLDNVQITAATVSSSAPYTTSFDGAVGSEWSNPRVLTLTNGDRVLGQFDNAGTTLSLGTVAGRQYTLIYDLWAFDSWDGDGRSCCGPDFFRLIVNGSEVYRTTMSMFLGYGSTIEAMPQQHLTNVAVGGIAGVGWGDKLYRRLSHTFTATWNNTMIEFDANGLSGGTDESWAIDNVRLIETSVAAPLLPIFRGRAEVSGLAVQNTNTAGATTGAMWLDLNNDGALESVQGGTSMPIRYWTGSAYAWPSSPAIQPPIVPMDSDNNGTLELWVRNSGSTTQALVYAGSGTSATSSDRVGANASLFGSVSGLRAVAPLDADSDGRIDLAMMGSGGNRLAINRGVRANGTLESFRLANLPSTASDVGSGAWVATGDINNDTIPDIYWSNGTGRLWLSDGAGGYAAADWALSVMNSAGNPAGAVFADFDNDGDLDLFVGRRGAGLAPTLWVNTGTTFVEQAASRGLGTLRDIVDASFGDYDNDGDLDVMYISASGFSGSATNLGSSGGYNFAIADDGLITDSRGGDGVLTDVDGDGDLDASFTSNSNDVPSRHWVNTLNNGNRSLTVRVIGKGAGYINAAGIGTRVELWDASNTQFLQRRDVGLAKGAGGMTPLWVHFGGVDENTTYTLRVWGRGTVYSVPVTPGSASTTFASGTRQRFYTFDENVHAPRVEVVRFWEAMQGE